MEETGKVYFNRMNHRGAATGTHCGKDVSVFGILPEETAEVMIRSGKRGNPIGKIRRINSSSKHRVPPTENHYLSCSPWQTISYDFQIELKKELLARIFRDVAHTDISPESFFPSPDRWEYRTKMEFSFIIQDRKLMLAFNERGSPNLKIPLPDGCMLAGKNLNFAAARMIDLFNRLKLTGGELKTLTLRESKSSGKVIALLTVKDKNFPAELVLRGPGELDGLIIAYSDPKSPSSIITEILAKSGDDFIEENILGMKFTYPFDGFFQNNIPQFENALSIIRGAIPRANRITELYSGTGVIGISLHDLAKEVIGIEISKPGIEHAVKNARANNAVNYKAINLKSEKADTEILSSSDVLIVDPPRSGIAPKLINKITESAPPLIIYLSCNPATLAKDYYSLRNQYNLDKLYGFDFHPQTPHIESLMVLARS